MPSGGRRPTKDRKARWTEARSPQWSRWSASTLVTTATVGASSRNEPSDSSASATKWGPVPAAALTPLALKSPPTANDGSSPAASRMATTIPVVVVLPWVPATAIPVRPVISRASSWARPSTGMSRSLAATSSGLVARIAVEAATRSGRPIRVPSWPAHTRAPSARSASRVADSLRSEPVTW